MNFNNIKKKSPKVWRKLDSYIKTVKVKQWFGAGDDYKRGDLDGWEDTWQLDWFRGAIMDFFDSQGIHIGVSPTNKYDGDYISEVAQYDWHIVAIGEKYNIYDGMGEKPPIRHITRLEALEAAINKAASILQQKKKKT